MSTTLKISDEAKALALEIGGYRIWNYNELAPRIQSAINAATATQQAECDRLQGLVNGLMQTNGNLEAECDRLKADLERFTAHGLLDCHAICDQRDTAVAERDQAKAECELLRMQAVACMTAAFQNTESTVKDRIDRSNPYWTQAYADVCAAVDREMKHRAECERLTKELASTRKDRNYWESECERERKQRQMEVGMQEYRGNTVSYIYDKERNYGAHFDRMRGEIATLTATCEALRKELAEAKGLLSVAKCPDANCDGNGMSWHVIPGHDGQGEQEQIQCQWCGERSAAIAAQSSPESQGKGANGS